MSTFQKAQSLAIAFSLLLTSISVSYAQDTTVENDTSETYANRTYLPFASSVDLSMTEQVDSSLDDVMNEDGVMSEDDTMSEGMDEPVDESMQSLMNEESVEASANMNAIAFNTWEKLTGVISSAPECIFTQAYTLYCFVQDSKKAMWYRTWKYNSASWGAWVNLGGSLTSDISCVSLGENHLDCFARGANKALWHRVWNGISWKAWESLGGVVTSHPNCIVPAANRIDCFVGGGNKALLHRKWNGSSWEAWENLGIAALATVATASADISNTRITLPGTILNFRPECEAFTGNIIYCFVVGADKSMWQRKWNGNSWENWVSLGGLLTSHIDCIVYWSTNQLDCLSRGSDNAMWHRVLDGNGWSGWGSLGGVFASGPDCTYEICYARGSDKAVWSRLMVYGVYDWWSMGGSFTSMVSCVNFFPDPVTMGGGCFARGSDKALWAYLWPAPPH